MVCSTLGRPRYKASFTCTLFNWYMVSPFWRPGKLFIKFGESSSQALKTQQSTLHNFYYFINIRPSTHAQFCPNNTRVDKHFWALVYAMYHDEYTTPTFLARYSLTKDAPSSSTETELLAIATSQAWPEKAPSNPAKKGPAGVILTAELAIHLVWGCRLFLFSNFQTQISHNWIKN